MLRVEAVETFYGPSQALFGVDLAVDAGEAVALLGRNGMGKTTTLRTICGLEAPRRGRVLFEGRDHRRRKHSRHTRGAPRCKHHDRALHPPDRAPARPAGAVYSAGDCLFR